ncbi:MAG: hypothetical protein RL392_945 [Pseudomonadota bacterium]|jgi:hypothetical protein
MQIGTIGKALIAISAILMLYALSMPVSMEGSSIVNIHLLSRQNNTLIISGVLFVGGIALFSVFKMKQTKEEELEDKQNRANLRQSSETRLKDILKRIIGLLGRAMKWAQTKTRGLLTGKLIRFVLGCVVGGYMYSTVFNLSYAALISGIRDGEDLQILAVAAGVVIFVATVVYLFGDRPLLKAFRNLLVIYLTISLVDFILVWAVSGRLEGLDNTATVLVSSILLAATVIQIRKQKT